MTSPESASVGVSIPALVGLSLSAGVALREGALTGPISDVLTVDITNGFLHATFQSDTELPLPPNPGLVNVVENGLPQPAFSLGLGEIALSITTQSDLDLAPVPEPSTLLLFGSSTAGVGALWRRYRHS
jgi:hypothetical protein